MGYIEDIKKINALAKELLQHNIAKDQDEAVVKAREMLVKKSGPGAVKNDEYMDLSKPSVQTISESGWKDAMAKNNEFVVNELKNFRNLLEKITAEMGNLKSELNILKNAKSEPNTLKNTQTTIQQGNLTEQPKNPQQNISSEPDQNQKADPKVGNYTTTDVAVEKFFYFGKK